MEELMPKKQAKALTVVGAMMAAVVCAPVVAADSPHFTANYVRGLQDMKMMKMMDTNGDGMVSKEEFMKYQEKMFDMMDKSKDGMLDKAEWTANLGGIGGKATN
jgi:nitrate reductase alpha subunit